MKILLPLDHAPCSAAAVDALTEQFKPGLAEVRLLHVVEWPRQLPMHLAMGQGPSAGEDLLASRDRAFRAGETLLSQAADRLRAAGFRTTRVMVVGSAGDVIIDAATEWKPDLIVIGSHGWQGLDRWLLGSVSDAVVRHVSCSVLVVRAPHGSAQAPHELPAETAAPAQRAWNPNGGMADERAHAGPR